MTTSAQKKVHFRYCRAYWITWRIIFRYLFLILLAKIFKPERMQKSFYRAHVKSSQQIISTLQNLKGLFIKIGQTLSVMSNFLPETFVKGLESLQDDVPAHDFKEIRERFLSDFQKTPEELFEKIETTPIASASLAQVHVAYLKTGEKLAIKVQYPGIEDLTRKDLRTLRRIFKWVDFFLPQYNLREVYQECEHVIIDELDFLKEAQNISAIRQNFQDQDEFIFPKVYEEFSSKKVLTLGFIEGAKITNLETLKNININKKELCEKILNFFCKQIFIDGIYHADPHPGNIIITPEGKIAMIDFGAIAKVSPNMRKGLTLFVEGIIKKESKIIGKALRMMGFISRQSDEETLDRVVEYFYSKISSIKIENFKSINLTEFHNLNDLVELRKLDISFRELTGLFMVPKEWILLERTLLILSGLSAQLDESHNPMQTVIPYAEEFLLGKEKNLNDLLLQAVKELLLAYLNLPHKLERTLKKIETGQVEIKIRGINKELKLLRKTLSVSVVALLASASGWLSMRFYSLDNLIVAERFEWAAYVLGTVFILKIIRK